MALDDPHPSAAQLAARYGAPIPPLSLWNDTIAELLAHRTVRAYRPDPLPIASGRHADRVEA